MRVCCSCVRYSQALSWIVLDLPRGWSGGAMVLGKLPVPGRPTYLYYSRARAYCACSGCGWGWFGHFFSHLSFSFLSPSLWETARYRLKYCLKGPLSPTQPTNQNLDLPYFSEVRLLIAEVGNIHSDKKLFPLTFLFSYLTGCVSHWCI